MILDWPNQKMSCTVSQAAEFLKSAIAAGYSNAHLGIDPMQSIAGEIDGMILVDANGQPIVAIPGFPSGDYRATFCLNLPSEDVNRWLNVGVSLDEIASDGKTLAEVLALPVGQTGAIG